MSRDTRFGLDGVTRRELLRIAGMAGVAGAVDTLAGTVTRRGDAIAQGAETVKFKAWANVDEYLRKQFEVFEKQYAGIKVDYESYPNPKFNETMLANFLGDVESDMFFNRDDLVSAWSRAGYLRPLDDLPGMDAYKRDFFPFVLDALTVQGRIYGLPLVSIFVGFMYNQKMLKDGGFDKPPRTWDEATKQAVALKRQKVVEYPIVVFLKNFPGNNWDWWNLVYAHGGNLFDESFQPLFPEKDETALHVLEWLVDGIHTSKIVNPGAIELDYASARDTVGAGRGAFVMNQFSELLDLLDPKKSKAAADIRMGFTPGPSAEKYPGTPTGYTRLYSMNAKTKRVDATWKLMQFLGGKDARGEYYFPKRFFIDLARGYGYKTLSGDAEVKSAADRWMGANVLSIGYERAKARQALKAPWFSEWDQYNMARLQEAVTKRVKPRDALADSARKARELAKG